MSDEIICPYCGGDGEVILDAKTLWYSVVCDECDARVGDRYSTEAQAIAAWNTRSVTAALALPEIAALVGAADGLGAMPEGYCFCGCDRVGDGSKTREPECADLRAALAAIEAAKAPQEAP